MIEFHIDKERCIQCGECALDCPSGVIAMDGYPKMTNEAGCMQCQHCLAICPTAAVSVLGKDPDASTPLKGNMPEASDIETLIKGRRAVRRYRDRDMPPELIDRLLEISCHAPTGVNARSVLFTVVRERTVMNRLRDHMIARIAQVQKAGALPEGIAGKYLGWAVNAWRQEGKDIIFRGAPHLIITSAPSSAHCPVQDALIALTTFQLAAHAHGAGTVWDGIFMMALAICPDVPGKLGIPKNHTLGYAMAFGEPAVEYHRTVQRGPALVNVVKW